MRASTPLAAFAIVTLCASCLDGAGQRPLGGLCSDDSECESPLVCQYGRCRSSCQLDRDCEAGACVASVSDPTVRVCTLADEGEEGDACPEELTLALDGLCRQACDDATSCSDGQECVASVCVDLSFTHASDVIIGTTGMDRISAVEATPTGGAAIAGNFAGSIDLGCGTATSGDGSHVLVASLDGSGGCLWSSTFGGFVASTGFGVTVDADGGVLATGALAGTGINLGGELRDVVGIRDVFVVAYDVAGEHRWDHVFGSDGEDAGLGVAVDEAGVTVVVGRFGGSVDHPTGIDWSSSGPSDGFVVGLGPAGELLFDLTFGGSEGFDSAEAVAAVPGGGFVVAGSYRGTADFGGGARSAAGTDIFVLRLDSEGSWIWDRTFGGVSGDGAFGVTVGPNGTIVATGQLSSGADLGSGAYEPTGASDAFVLALGADGSHLWDRSFGGSGEDRGRGVAASPVGAVLVVGGVTGGADLGGGPHAGAGQDDGFAAAFGTDGELLWERLYGSAEFDECWGASADASRFLISGFHGGPVDFGGGEGAWTGSSDGFLVFLES